jgi:RHS repeat-associated protein
VTYAPYGARLGSSGDDGPGDTGHVEDRVTGLVYAQQRDYDPMIGRFLSVDPVSAYGGDPRHFNRYSYAYNNPYKFTDPDGRDGELFWTAPDQVTVTFKYMMTGVSPSFTPAQLEAQVAKNYSGSVTVNGVNVTVKAQAVQVTAAGKGVNTINVINDTAGVTKSGRSETNAIGGNKITLGATGVDAATPATGSHEVGHGLGAGDQYKGGLGANGSYLPADISGASNVMKDLSGTNANSQTLGEIIKAPTNVNTCSKGVSAASGGC